MRRFVWTLVATAVLVGCGEAKRCTADSDCATGAVCLAELCVQATPDGSTGGGDGGDSGTDGGLDGGADSGVDGGADGGDGGEPNPCDTVACTDPGYECRPNVSDAGECVLAFSGLELVSPDGGTYGPDASVPVVARLVRKAGFSVAMPVTPVVVVGAEAPRPMVLQGDDYAADIRTAGRAEGTHLLTVMATFADAGLTANGGFVVDATGPELRPTVVSTPGYGMNQADVYYPTDPDQPTSFRKDALVEVEVTSPATDVDVGSVVLEVGSAATGGSRTIIMSQSCPGAPAALCRRFIVDLAQVPLNAMRGELTLRVAGADIRQNAGTPAPGSPTVPVTRWRWATRLTNGSIKATPALTSQGHVAVGVFSGSNQGLTLLAADAGVVWRAGTQSVEASPVVGARAGGAQFVFFQQKDMSETLLAANVATGALLSGCGANLTVLAGSTPVSPALVQDGSDDVGIIGTQPRTTGYRIAGYRPFAGTCYATNASGGSFPGNVVTDGVTAYYPDATGRLTRADISSPSSIGSLGQFPTSTLGTGTVNGLSFFSSGTQLAGGGGGGPGIGALFQFLVPSGADAGVVAGTPVIAPVLTGAGEVIAGFQNNSQLELRKYTSGAVQMGASVLTGASYSAGIPGMASPVLGLGDAIYVVSSGGYLVAANQSNLAVRYEGPTSNSVVLGSVSASPTLDCNRERPGSESGILYFATESGYLASIIVDSKGLDTTAQWPKYQRDAQNSGNVGRPMPAACP